MYWVSTQYAVRIPINQRKKVYGIGSSLNAWASGEKGRYIAIAIISVVNAITGAVAQLCMNGILRVRIMWMMSVCESRLSINHPV